MSVWPDRQGRFYVHVQILRAFNRRPAIVRQGWGPQIQVGQGSFSDALAAAAEQLAVLSEEWERRRPT